MPGDIQIRQLQYLVALARERHFGRAAAACHASQPALSAALRKLETELGVTIVQRKQRFTGFTPEGEQVVAWAHRILSERDALLIDLARMREGLTATLRIGAIPTAVPVAPLLTGPFCDRHPLASVRLDLCSSRDIDRRLTEFDLDVALTYLTGEDSADVHELPLYTETYLLLTPADSELAERDSVGWDEAADKRLCALGQEMQSRRILDSTMARAGVQLRPVIETGTVGALFAHVATRRFSSIIAHPWLYAFGVPDGMRVVRLNPQPRGPRVGIQWSAQRHESVVATAFFEATSDVDVAGRLDAVLEKALARTP
ncbi:MAG: LysR family transcriptional regulator [Actinobacteria bacterium]|nr:LysR family transcriptional regulator [Actinomycetota bacterium]